jgi:hypothetical protein
MNWTKGTVGGSGGWVSGRTPGTGMGGQRGAPPVPPRDPNRNNHWLLAGGQRGAPQGLNAEFLRNPLAFMRLHPMSPPDNATGDFGAVLGTRDVDQMEPTKSGGMMARTLNIQMQRGGGIRFARFVNHAQANFPGAKTFAFDGDGSGGGMPIHWLPWKSERLITYTIPASPSGLEDPDDIDYPGIFFTAGINGCSVLVQGNPHQPTVTHGGIETALKQRADAFWHDQMRHFGRETAMNPVRGEANTFDYMKGSAYDAQVKRYLEWLASDTTQKLTIDFISPFGCAFGIRFGRSWTFYLQKNIVTKTLTLHRRGEVMVDPSSVKNPTPKFNLASTGEVAVPHSTVMEKVSRKLGPLNLPFKKKVETQIFGVTRTASRPMQIGEIYPRMLVGTDLKNDVFLR